MHDKMQHGAAEAEAQQEHAWEAIPASADEEAWVLKRIEKALRMADALRSIRIVEAERDMLDRALDGIVQGCAVEIIRTLGKEPSFINIAQGRGWRPDSRNWNALS